MSTYSTTTESNININKPILNDDLNYKKLQKFNKFYLTNSNFSCKDNYKSHSKISKPNDSGNIYNINLKIPLTTRKSKISDNIKNIHSRNYNLSHKPLTKYKTFSNYNNKMKNLFNPEILDGEYVSKPKKIKRKTTKIEMPKFNTFLANKIKDKSLSIKISNCITGNLSKFIMPNNYNKSFINKSTTNIKIKQKIKYQRNDFYKDSRLYAARKHRKTVSNIINKFNQKLNYDKKENLNEYNNFMNSLRINLSLSKYKNSNYFAYE